MVHQNVLFIHAVWKNLDSLGGRYFPAEKRLVVGAANDRRSQLPGELRS